MMQWDSGEEFEWGCWERLAGVVADILNIFGGIFLDKNPLPLAEVGSA
jgi:hypothetical protein